MPSDPLLVPAGNPGPMTGPGNNTWLLNGRSPSLIDAGVGLPDHLAALSRVLDQRPLVRVLLTHGHTDHASGVPALRASWPAVEVCKFLLPGESGSRALVDGDVVRAGDADLTVLHTPGHAADHVCFWDGDRRYLYAGDMVLANTTVMIPAAPGGNLRRYLQSLARLATLAPVRIYPGHGPVIDRPLDLIARYLEHRRFREQQILECLADGVVAVDAIVARLYPTLSGPLVRAATMTVEAHLEKLREESKLS